MDAVGLDHVNLAFPEDRLDEVIDFYVGTLGLESQFEDPYEAVADDPGLFRIYLGGGTRFYVNPTDGFEGEPMNYRHLAVRIDEAPEAVRTVLAEADRPIDHEVDREREPLGEYTSFYVPDPFGYTVELMCFG